jgi:hypothetical protein
MTGIGTRVAHEKTASEFYVVDICGYFLAIICCEPDAVSRNSPQTITAW